MLQNVKALSPAHDMLYSHPVPSQPLRFGEFVELCICRGSSPGGKMHVTHVKEVVPEKVLLIGHASLAQPSLLSPFDSLDIFSSEPHLRLR